MGLAVFAAQADLFAPGNVIFADPNYNPGAENGQVVELKITGNSAAIVNVIRWNLDDTDRRRPLGIDVDPNGTVWVGITAAFGDSQEFPEGIAEILRIEPNGTQTFFWSDITKGTYLAAIGPNEIVITSNATDGGTPYRYKIENNEIVEWAEFIKAGHGEAYNDEIGSVIASLHDQVTVLRISLDGTLEEERNVGDDGFGSLWGVAQVPDSNNIILGSHNIDLNRNRFAVYNALDLAAGPRIITIDSGFIENGLPADYTFRSLFNMAVIPGAPLPVSVDAWELY
jgi:hypothetical protein